jgi:hypothetical protein
VKTTLFAAALVVTFTLSALAAQKPSQHLAGNPNAQPSAAISVPPPACDPCIFYGGDFDPSSPNSAGLSDENTLFIPGSSTYGNFNIPTGFTVTVTGILVNVQADAAFDPQVASYDVRQGVTEGDGGTDLATGTANATVASTGRSFLGLQEYTVAVNLATPLVLGPGNYWFNVTPECQNGATDGSCSVGRMFASNTAGGRTNSIHGAGETNHEIFLNSSFFGFTWANWCDSSLGLNGQQCNGLSFGVMGTSTP